jgi:hypothetical protein
MLGFLFSSDKDVVRDAKQCSGSRCSSYLVVEEAGKVYTVDRHAGAMASIQ